MRTFYIFIVEAFSVAFSLSIQSVNRAKIGLFGSNCGLTKLLTKVGDKVPWRLCACVCVSIIWVIFDSSCSVSTLVFIYVTSLNKKRTYCTWCVAVKLQAVYLSSVETDTGRDRQVFPWRQVGVALSTCVGTEVGIKSPLHIHTSHIKPLHKVTSDSMGTDLV